MDAATDFDEAFEELDALNAGICGLQARFLASVAQADRQQVWRDSGATGMAHLLSMRYGVSWWKAYRWVQAAHALEDLPRTLATFERGELGIDKVLELCRFATAETEAGLLGWAERVSSGAIRRRGDLEARRERQEAEQIERERSLRYSFEDEGRRFLLQAELPAAEGAVVAGAIEHLASQIPVMPGEEEASYAECRRADALVALCLGERAAGEATVVVVHASAESLASNQRACELQGGGTIHAQTLHRLACSSRLQVVLEDQGRNPLAMGRASRDPSEAMLRQLTYRDTECRFPGCGARRFTQAHHIRWWSHGGGTTLDNLVLLCTFHHKLVHEYGWSLTRDPDDTVRWYRSDGTRYRAGPAPPRRTDAPQLLLAAVVGWISRLEPAHLR